MREALFNPSRIAIVGARDEPSDAANLYRTIQATGFGGEIVLVNPNHEELFGQPCLASLDETDGEIDLAIVLVGSGAATETAVMDSVRAGAKLIQIYGSIGPSSTSDVAGDIGKEQRILGPSSLGFMNISSSVSALVVHPDNVPMIRAGGVRVAAQSGGLLLSAAEYGRIVGLGAELIVSTGVEMDLSAVEIAIDALLDPELKAMGLILEGIKSASAFQELLASAKAASKPVVILKLGRSEPGAVHAETHSQNVAGPSDVFDDLCRQHGVLVTRSIRDFVEVLRLLEAGVGHTPDGIAFIGLSGGLRVLISDVADGLGMKMARFDDTTTAELEDLVGSSGADNPIDLGAIALQDPMQIRQVVRTLIRDTVTGVLALVTHLRESGGSPAYQSLISEFIGSSEEAQRHGKRLVVIGTSPSGIGGKNWERCLEAGVPVLSDVSSIGNLTSAMRRHRSALEYLPKTTTATGDLLRSRPDANPTPGEVLDSLRRDGIRFAQWRMAVGRDEALKAAAEIGFPVAIKLHSPDILHKTEIGGVVLGIEGGRELSAGFDRMIADAARHGHDAGDRVMVQEMVPGNVELMIATSLQPEFGRILTLALGGIHVEFVGDATHAYPPFGESHALRMLESLRSQHLLNGVRGGRAVDRQRVARLVSAFSLVSADLPDRVTSLELNPVICSYEDLVAVDLAMVVEAGK